MRWPFRKRDAPDPEPVAPTHEPDRGDRPAIPASPAWASLPPLQRTAAAEIELTAPSAAVLGDVSQRWAPATVLEPLGHELTPLGPSGTIGLTGAPIEAWQGQHDLVDRPAAPRASTVQRAPADAQRENTVAERGEPILPPRPAPFRPAVLDVARPRVAQRALTSAADPVGPPVETHASPAAPPGPPAATSPIGPLAPPETEPGPASSDVSTVQRLDQVSDAPPAVRRLGLGAPLAGGRAGMPLQRAAAQDVPSSPTARARLDRPARVTVQRLPLDDLPVGRPAAVSSAGAPGGAAHAADVSGLDRGGSPAAAFERPDAERPSSRPTAVMTGSIDVSRLAAVDRPAPGPDPVHVLVMPGRLHATTAVVQRDPGTHEVDGPGTVHDGDGPGHGSGSGHDAGPPLALARAGDERDTVTHDVAPTRTAEDRARPEAIRLPAPPALLPPVMRSAVDAAQPSRREPRVMSRLSEPGARVATALPLQRSVPPIEGPPVALPLARAAVPPPPPKLVPDTVAVQRTEQPVAVAPHAPAGDAATSEPAPIVSVAPSDVPIQRAADDAAPGSAPVPTASSTPGGGPLAGASDKDVDELARRLYDRIRRRLSRELLADRERAGLLTDLR